MLTLRTPCSNDLPIDPAEDPIELGLERYRVLALMEEFVNIVSSSWEKADTVGLAAYVLWGLNRLLPAWNREQSVRSAARKIAC